MTQTKPQNIFGSLSEDMNCAFLKMTPVMLIFVKFPQVTFRQRETIIISKFAYEARI